MIPTKEDFLISNQSPWKEYKTKYNLYKKAQLPWEWYEKLIDEGKRVGIDIFSSPFDVSAVDFLENLSVPAYKIASPEITDIPLIKRLGKTGKPVILSTGLAEVEDIELALETLRSQGCSEIALLKCTTAYPTPFEEINLRTIPDMAKRFGCIGGLSDHTLGIGVSVAAVAVGAKIIEKHFTLDKENDSVDSFFSLDPEEFGLMVKEIRNIEKALGKVTYALSKTAEKNVGARRSLYIAEDIKKEEALTVRNCKSVRPGYGLHPKYLDEVIGKKVNRDLQKGDRLSLDVID